MRQNGGSSDSSAAVAAECDGQQLAAAAVSWQTDSGCRQCWQQLAVTVWQAEPVLNATIVLGTADELGSHQLVPMR
jgi:hypothetical protein